MQKNGWMDLLGGLLGMQNHSSRPAAQEQSAPQTASGGWAMAGKPVKTNQNYSLTKPNFDPLDYSQSAYIKLLKRHDAISKRIDVDLARKAASPEEIAQTAAESAQSEKAGPLAEQRAEGQGTEQSLQAERRQAKARISGPASKRSVASNTSAEANGSAEPVKRRGRPRKNVPETVNITSNELEEIEKSTTGDSASARKSSAVRKSAVSKPAKNAADEPNGPPSAPLRKKADSKKPTRAQDRGTASDSQTEQPGQTAAKTPAAPKRGREPAVVPVVQPCGGADSGSAAEHAEPGRAKRKRKAPYVQETDA